MMAVGLTSIPEQGIASRNYIYKAFSKVSRTISGTKCSKAELLYSLQISVSLSTTRLAIPCFFTARATYFYP
tara:strand:- start:534 stop:749 length:216 start_codon:yes stop_codon:yes gene_type:complete